MSPVDVSPVLKARRVRQAFVLGNRYMTMPEGMLGLSGFTVTSFVAG